MNRQRRAWLALRALSASDRRLLARAWLLMAPAAIGLRALGFGRLQAALQIRDDGSARRIDVREAQSIGRLVDVAARWNPISANCLVRSLVLCHLLQRRGLAATLRIGVTNPGGDFAAHAWVEHGGVALAAAGAAGDRYTPLGESILPRGA